MANPAESAAKKLASEMESFGSIELRYHVACVNKDPARLPSYPRTFLQTCHYIETAANQRLLEERMTTDLAPLEINVHIEYDQGSKCASLLRTDKEGILGREQISIRRFFASENSGDTGRPTPLKYLYAGLRPLHEVLSRAEYLGEGRWLDRNCDKFLLTHIKGSQDPVNRIYWLDRETALTLRLEHYENDKKRAEERPYFAWNAESLDEVSGRHLTLKSELLQYDVEGRDPKLVLMQYKITTDEAVLDREYTNSTFWPTIAKDTVVLDLIKNKAVFPKKEATDMPLTKQPIRAVDSGGWEISYSNGAIILGLAILSACILIRRRSG